MLRYYVLTESICSLVAAIPFFLLLEFLFRNTARPVLHRLGTYCFSGYLLAVFAVTGIPSLYRLRFYPQIGLIPFDGFESAPKQFFLNLLLFIPLGFLLPLLWQNYRSFIKTVSAGFLLSLFIEALQLFSFRTTDIDDLIMNTLGAVIGWMMFMLFYLLFPRIAAWFQPDLADEEEGREPLLYGGACWLTVFLLQPIVSDIFSMAFY